MMFLGVDSCKAGWCCACIQHVQISITCFPDIKDLLNHYPEAKLILIDIPIGLTDKSVHRDVDSNARKLLGKKFKSTIFTPPTRATLSAKNYEKAKEINDQICGQKISIQSWNITPKIREIDDLLLVNENLENIIKEAHPEICFLFLNLGNELQHKKKSPKQQGIHERLNILNLYNSQIHDVFLQARRELKRTEVASDDIIDALCLMLTAKFGHENGMQTISGSVEKDIYDIEMKIHYYDPALS